ncbi:myosin-2 essential light chain [Drosophila ficusphila]|uniref:myosin-2 essential light chain n=1 Tax=Drosophila ficusphila TaxID=30025 RepID=UPI0007E85B13|nr:myosin-2 essential light chain [Drosophila ficusphila]
MSAAGNQLNPSSSHHPSSQPANFNQGKKSRKTATSPSPSPSNPSAPPPPNRKPEKSRILELHAIFLGHDTRGDNKISIRHLGDCLRVMGANPTEAVVTKHVRQLQAASLERVSFDEVMAIYSNLGKHGCRSTPEKKRIEADQFADCLRLFDTDNSGLLSAARLRRILGQCGERMSAFEVDELLKGRINEQGLVDYRKLIHDIVNG